MAGLIDTRELIHHGHEGSLIILPAISPEDALSRLDSSCLMSNLGLSLNQIRCLMASNLGLITFQERIPDGKRRLKQIIKLRGLEHKRYDLQPLFTYSRFRDSFKATGVRSTWN